MGVISCMCQPLILLFSLQTPLFHPLAHTRKKTQRTNSVAKDYYTNSISISEVYIAALPFPHNIMLFAVSKPIKTAHASKTH